MAELIGSKKTDGVRRLRITRREFEEALSVAGLPDIEIMVPQEV